MVQVKSNTQQRGSMGIPEDMMQEHMRQIEKNKKKAAQPEESSEVSLPLEPPSEETEANASNDSEAPTEDKPSKSFKDELKPEIIFEKLGIEIGEDDFQFGPLGTRLGHQRDGRRRPRLSFGLERNRLPLLLRIRPRPRHGHRDHDERDRRKAVVGKRHRRRRAAMTASVSCTESAFRTSPSPCPGPTHGH